MFEPNLDYDPLVSAIYQVQKQLAPALDAMEAVAQSLSGADARRANDVASKLASERVFSRRDMSALVPVLRAASSKIEEGRIRKVEYREFGDPEVYWCHTDEALELMRSVQKLVKLREAIETVHAIRRADQLANKFRSQDG
ncbi:hypothetical protein PL335_16700 (plasmid) [Sulfitobacter faviae]|uniref:hypothetical protein n=1 Tax=Sulfitobacter faviae TaxID=1775881 RepID=UPI00230746D0|nr:hypothetical protein [Sulfitobacter faviae]WCE68615.1 hypothetical protein PL335_16700 [Sulfitobacter faviae]